MMHLSALINGPLITRNGPIRRRMALFLLCRVRPSLNTSCTVNRVNRTCVLYIYIYLESLLDKIMARYLRDLFQGHSMNLNCYRELSASS